MGLGVGRCLRKIKVEAVPGYHVSLLDLISFRQNLLGVATPLNVYGRWRKLLAPLVPEQHFQEAGLENLREVYPGKFDRQIVVIQCLRNVIAQKIEGVVAEFGCFRGHTAIHIAETMRSMGDRSKLYLFDSFQGFPKSDVPEDASWAPRELAADFNEVVRRFEEFENVEIVKGFFKDTLPALPNLVCKFAHVDADLYISIKEVNRWLLDRVATGGMIVYDDYGFANCTGAKKAVDEDLGERSDFFKLYLPTGQYLAIKKGR